MTHPPLRVVQVGFGPWGENWARVVLPRVREFVVVAEVDARWLQAGDPAATPPRYASLTQALSDVPADAVLATVGIEAHYAVVKEALTAGKHVLLEKPFTVELKDALELTELAADRGVALVVAQNYRFWPEAITARHVIKTGAIGEVINARVTFRRNHNEYVPALSAPPGSPTSSVLYQIAVHHFDLVRFILGEVARIDARRWKRGNVPGRTLTAFSATMELESGPLVEYSANQASLAPSTAWSGAWEIEGTAGSVLWQGNAPGGADEVTGVLLQREHEAPEEVVVERLARADREAVVLEFVRCVRDGWVSDIGAAANLNTMQLVSDVVGALHEG